MNLVFQRLAEDLATCAFFGDFAGNEEKLERMFNVLRLKDKEIIRKERDRIIEELIKLEHAKERSNR